MFYFAHPSAMRMPSPDEALPGRDEPMRINARHAVLGTSMIGPYPPNFERAMFGMGCFWGAEKRFWTLAGVHTTAVGYAAGYTPNPTYEEVCSGLTGHAEVVLVVWDPAKLSFSTLLETFWESHDPTTPNRQGNDVGTQYRSGLYTTTESQRALAERSRDLYQRALREAGLRWIVTEIRDAGPFYFAEDYHQQYLHKNPDGYCGLGGTGVSCPKGIT
jgi:peptide-methionine (S)-S-oxide reductase